jgi:phospholipase/carboxylesterase
VANGTPSQNIFLIGFSQGGSVALSLTVTTHYKLGGVVGLGTFLPYPNLVMARQS